MGGVCKNSTAVMAKMFDDPLWEKNIVNLSIILSFWGSSPVIYLVYPLLNMLWGYLGILDSEKTHTWWFAQNSFFLTTTLLMAMFFAIHLAKTLFLQLRYFYDQWVGLHSIEVTNERPHSWNKGMMVTRWCAGLGSRLALADHFPNTQDWGLCSHISSVPR